MIDRQVGCPLMLSGLGWISIYTTNAIKSLAFSSVCKCGSSNQITKHFGPCLHLYSVLTIFDWITQDEYPFTKCKQSRWLYKMLSVRIELVHIWFQWTKFIAHVAYQLNLWQSNTIQATVPSSWIQALPFGIFFVL